MDLSFFVINILLRYVIKVCGNVCISWTLYNDQFRVTCKTDKLVSSISFYDPSGDEVAFCLLPYPQSLCSAKETSNSITQDIATGETSLVVRTRSASKTNGLWMCIHGYKNENASALVMVPNYIDNGSVPQVILSGQKYVAKQRKISLMCSSDKDSIDSSATFYVDNKLYMQIHKNTTGCFSTLGTASCQSDVCQCFENGRSYILQYNPMVNNGTITFKCSMNFKKFGTLFHCLHIFVVDITGPVIKAEEGFPLTAGTVAEVTCTTEIKDFLIKISLNCLDTEIETTSPETTDDDNIKTYIAKISKFVTSADDRKSCSCKVSGVITLSTTTKLHVKKAPILNTDDTVICNDTESIILSCSISGELLIFGFYPWVHSFGNHMIRTLSGNVTGNLSVLEIDSCSYEDNGGYTCKAWNQDSMEIITQKRTVNIIVSGPPVVVGTHIDTGLNTILSARFLSIDTPNTPQWYHRSTLLPNSKDYKQNMSTHLLVIGIHGRIITCNGFIANLTIDIKYYQSTKFQVLLENKFGHLKQEFELHNEDIHSNIKPFVWILIAIPFLFLVVVVVATLMVWQQKIKSHRNTPSTAIYFAAPQSNNGLNIYNQTTSHYEEINVDYLYVVSENSDTSDKDNDAESNYDQTDDFDHYLEID